MIPQKSRNVVVYLTTADWTAFDAVGSGPAGHGRAACERHEEGRAASIALRVARAGKSTTSGSADIAVPLVPSEEYDGGGLGMAALSWVGEEIAAAGCSLLLIVVSPAIVGSILTKHGTPAQKERWLRGIGTGTTKIAFAITESEAGSNSHRLSTSLRRDGDRFVLRG